jgi:hypothetical protein
VLVTHDRRFGRAIASNEKPIKTRVFRAGNSQAVRVPKALELPEAHGKPVGALRRRIERLFAVS